MTPPRAIWRVRKPLARPEEPNLEGLVEEGTDAIPVRITIVQDDVVTGWDDGALGFEEDAVWFSGRATSFHLAAPDIRPGAYLLSRRVAVTSGEALNQGFPLRHPSRDVWVRVQVLCGNEEEKKACETRLITCVQHLRALRTSGAQSEYPPLAPRPGLLRSLPKTMGLEKERKLRLACGTLGGLAIVTSGIASSAHLTGKGFDFLASIGGGFVACAILGFKNSVKLSQKTLHRISREEDESALKSPAGLLEGSTLKNQNGPREEA